MEMQRKRSTTSKLPLLAAVLLALVAMMSMACSALGLAAEQPKDRTIYMAVVEPKGSTTTAVEPFPAQQLPSGSGYNLIVPDDSGKWVVETYRFTPGTIVVNEGDSVTLEILGVNGVEHPIVIDEYGISTVLKRGEVQRLNFVADKPGIFKIICTIHAPSMQADLVVLQR